MSQNNQIKFIYSFSNAYEVKQISRDNINTYKFAKGFNEVITAETPYIRPYIDCDHLDSIDSYNEFVSYCDRIKQFLGEYSIGGYTSNEDVSDATGLKYINGAEKFISIHIIFYQSRIQPAELQRFVTENKDFLNKQIDTNVYKLKSRQLFRHCLSDKRVKKTDVKYIAGNILNGATPEQQIITASGDEKEVSYQDLVNAFDIKPEFNDFAENVMAEEENTDPAPIPKRTDRKKVTIDDIDYNESLVLLEEDEMLDLLNSITTEPHNNDLVHTIVPLYHSPYPILFIINVVGKWYEQIEHATPDNVSQIVRAIYEKEASNKWLFSLIKKIPDCDKKAEWLARFRREHIDMTVNINNTNICYNDVAKRSYTFDELPKLLTDLRSVIGYVGSRYFIKEKDTNSEQYTIRECKKEEFHDTLNKRKPFRGNNKINLSQIASAYSNYFNYDDIRLYKPTEETKELESTVINVFQGYKYPEIITDDFSILQPFLNHVKVVNCHGDERKYEYIMNWFANIIKNLAVKNGTMPIMYGSQGSGKSIFVEIMAELLGHLAVPNADDLDKVFGKFNVLSERKVLVVLNEIGEATDKFAYSEKLKSRITQVNTIYEQKCVSSRTGLNYANYIMTANYPDPIVSQKGDRRTIYYPTDNKYCGHKKDYFEPLCKAFQPTKQGPYDKTYMGILLHYMLTQFQPEQFDFEELIININNNSQTNYNEQLERQYQCLDSVHRFVVDHYKLFEIGFPVDFIKLDGYKTTGISKKLKSICQEPTRHRQNSKIVHDYQEQYNRLNIDMEKLDGIFDPMSKIMLRFYKLKPQGEIPDLYNIIEYKRFQDRYDEEHDEPYQKQRTNEELAAQLEEE